MLSTQLTQELRPKIKMMQIIIGALPLGALVALILMMIVRDQPKFTQSLEFLSLFGIGFACLMFSVAICIIFFQSKSSVRQLAKKVSKKSDGDERLANKAMELYQTNAIVRGAMMEGATFLNVMMYFLTGSIFNLGVAVVGIALLCFQIPFFNNAIQAIERMIDSAKEENKLLG